MKPETKLDLMKRTDSYWMLLPEEIKDMILKYKESQELIEWRESFVSRALCEQIRLYDKLRREWFIGPIRCIPFHTTFLYYDEYKELVGMAVYGHYWNLNGVKQQMLLSHSLPTAIMNCRPLKMGLWYQTNEHVQLPFPEHGPQDQIGLDEAHG